MNLTRMAVGAMLGVMTTLCLLFLMNLLINNQFEEPDDYRTIPVAPVLMPNISTEKRAEAPPPVKPPEPAQPPEEMSVQDFEIPEIVIPVDFDKPIFNDTLLDTRALVFTEGEYIPIVKVQPEYPNSALSRGIEGYCTVAYTITETGVTRDARTVTDDCRTKDGQLTTVFDRVSVRAALKFKYKPKVVDGKPVEIHGVKSRFVFEMK
ncbi:MAG: energy transducer TonB [Cellvibrio sp. 79]|nr:MAG: energy transducer TonB [Cellvibrio sp. 79]